MKKRGLLCVAFAVAIIFVLAVLTIKIGSAWGGWAPTTETEVTVCGTVPGSGNYYLSSSITGAGTCMDITENDVVFDCRGKTIYYASAGQNSTYGFSAVEVHNISIYNCSFIKAGGNGTDNAAINFLDVNDSIIENVSIMINGTYSLSGIYIAGTAGKVVNHSVTNAEIFIGQNWSNSFYGSLGSANFGIWFANAHSVVINRVKVTTNGSNDNYGIYANLCSSVNISNSTIYTHGTTGVLAAGFNNNFGIAFTFSNYSNIINNTIITNGKNAGNRGISIRLASFKDYIVNNLIRTNGTSKNYGIYFENNSNSTIFNNTISSNGTRGSNYGIYLLDASLENVSLNTIISNGTNLSHGIYLEGDSDFNLISYNTISSFGIGSNAFGLNTTTKINHPENNNLTNNLFGDIDGDDLNFSSYSINYTYLIDQVIRKYAFVGLGGTLNVKDTNFGEINFIQAVNGSGSNFSANVSIANNSISINETNYGLNKSANVTFYGLDNLPIPVILKNNSVCVSPLCNNITSFKGFSSGNIKINVTTWGNYSIYSYPSVAILSPIATTYTLNKIVPFSVNLKRAGSCNYSLDAGITNTSLTANSSNTGFSDSISFSNGARTLNAYCKDGWMFSNYSVSVAFTVNIPAVVEETVGSGPSRRTTSSSTSIAIQPEEEIELEDIEELCVPDWSCSDWGKCNNKVSTRSCSDANSCGTGSKPSESMSCSCTSSIKCSEWSPCKYVDEITDIITGQISVLGYKEKTCADSKGCVESYTEREACKTSKAITTTEEKIFGEETLVLEDEKTENLVATINLEALKEGRLEISFLQSKQVYSPDCFDGLKNGDETQIDCGGSCKQCAAEIIFIKYAKMWPWWILIVLLILLIIHIRNELKDRALNRHLHNLKFPFVNR